MLVKLNDFYRLIAKSYHKNINWLISSNRKMCNIYHTHFNFQNWFSSNSLRALAKFFKNTMTVLKSFSGEICSEVSPKYFAHSENDFCASWNASRNCFNFVRSEAMKVLSTSLVLRCCSTWSNFFSISFTSSMSVCMWTKNGQID